MTAFIFFTGLTVCDCSHKSYYQITGSIIFMALRIFSNIIPIIFYIYSTSISLFIISFIIGTTCHD